MAVGHMPPSPECTSWLDLHVWNLLLMHHCSVQGSSILPVARVRTCVISAFLPHPESDLSAVSKFISNPTASHCLLGHSCCLSPLGRLTCVIPRTCSLPPGPLQLTQHSSLVDVLKHQVLHFSSQRPSRYLIPQEKGERP